MSPENLFNHESVASYEATLEFCTRINQALEKAARLRQDQHNEELAAELLVLERSLVKDGFDYKYRFRLVISEGANARTSREYVRYEDTSPREFIADSVNRIDYNQADFYYSKGEDPELHLTSFDFNLHAEPFLDLWYTPLMKKDAKKQALESAYFVIAIGVCLAFFGRMAMIISNATNYIDRADNPGYMDWQSYSFLSGLIILVLAYATYKKKYKKLLKLKNKRP